MTATGGNGAGGGGGGAGLGGALFVAGVSDGNGGASVTLDNVSFSGDCAVGGRQRGRQPAAAAAALAATVALVPST